MVPSLLPAQLGIPGAMELVVLLLVFVMLAAPVALLVLGVVIWRRRGTNETAERIAELEAEVDDLKRRLDDRE